MQALSFARQLEAKGYEVYVECDRRWHSIFEMCRYAAPLFPGQSVPRGFTIKRVVSLEVGRSNLGEFRKSKLKWWQFWESKHPELGGMEWSNPFLFDLGREADNAIYKMVLFAPGLRDEKGEWEKVALLAAKLHSSDPCLAIGDSFTYKASNLVELVSSIRNAKEVVTINNGISLIADAVRTSYDHVIDPMAQDDFFSDKQRRHKL